MDELRQRLLARMLTKRRAYRMLFLDDKGSLKPEALIVMRDMAKFANFGKPTVRVSKQSGTIDPLAMATAEGRREFFIRMFITMLRVDDETLTRLATPQQED